LNLGPLATAGGGYVGLNLGVEWDDEVIEPPEPVIRGLRATAGFPWGSSPRLRNSVVAVWGRAPLLRRQTRLGWGRAAPLQRALDLAWGTSPLHKRTVALPWGNLPLQRMTRTLPWASLPTAKRDVRMPWRARLARKQAATTMPWHHPGHARVDGRMTWRGEIPTTRADKLFRWRYPGLAKRTWRLPWGYARLLPWIVRPPEEPEPPVDPESPFPAGNVVGLNLSCPTTTVPGVVPLNLGVYACYAVRPRQRTYIVLNSIAVVRLPDRTPIEVDSIGIAGGADSWGWSFDLNLCKPSDLALLKPNVSGPREIEVTLNGYIWTAVVESYGSRKEFAAAGVSVSGRSRTAALASPYAPLRSKVTTEERLAAQLVDEELADTGFTATYDTVDWVVPPGAWYYDSTSPLDAINRIAEASGAVVQSDPEDKVLRIRPRYPVSPWLWPETAPDASIVDDIVLGLSMQVRSQPNYDAVVVTGEIQGKGVTVRVKRDGEAGNLYAPQVSSQLINTAPVGTERGRNILSDRGEQASFDLVLPLFAAPVMPGQTGRVMPLDLVEVVEGEEIWHGLCTNVRLEARIEGTGGSWVIEQTVTIERHYSDAD
jgi:hypothetical protein